MEPETGPTRDEHLAWAKERAKVYIDAGDWMEAWNSFLSDLRKHPATARHCAIELGTMLLLGGHNRDPESMWRFIEGFN